MKKIGIVYNSEKSGAKEHALEIEKWFLERGLEVLNIAYEEFLNLKDESISDLELVVALGGDGTVLHIADKIVRHSIPVLGINFGNVGFLIDIEPDNTFTELNNFLIGCYELQERTRIQAKVFHNGEDEPVKIIDGLNEIIVGGIRRMVYLRISIVDKSYSAVIRIKGDGACFCTMTGSTGYNLSMGGPIIPVDTLFGITANNGLFGYDVPLSHGKLANSRSCVTPTESKITVEITNQEEDNLPYLIADSVEDYKLQKGDYVEITKSPLKTLLMKKKK